MSERGVGPLPRAAARGVRDASHRHLLDQVVLHLHGRRLRERRRLEPAGREEPKLLGCVRVVALERVAPPHLRRRRLRHRQVAARLLHQARRAAASTNTTSTAEVELERPAKARERHRLHDEDRMSAVVVVVAAQARAAHLRGAAAAHAGPHAAAPRLAVARHAHLRHRILVLAGRFPIVLVEERRGLAVAVDDLERG